MDRLVSIIILNYNRYQYTIDCLKSLERQTYKNFEVILVDNGSEYNLFLRLKKELNYFKNLINIILIRLNVNLFFTGGNNKAIKIAHGRYICLLNNDTVVEPNFIESMVNFLETNSNAGMISPKIKAYKNKNYLWNAGADINLRSINITKIRGLWEYDPNNQKYSKISLTDYAVGTALFVKKEVIDKIGLLDEIFFMYFEETEWNFRAKKIGYQNYYVPTTIVYHKVTPFISKKALLLKQFFLNRNAQIFVLKHAGLLDILIFYIKFTLRNLRIILLALISRKFYITFLRLWSLLQGFRIGIKKRTNRSCRKILIKDYRFIKKIEKRIQLLKI